MAKLYHRYVDEGLPLPFHVILCIVAYLFWTSSIAILVLPFVIYRLFKIMEVKLIDYKNFGSVMSKFDVPFLHESENNRNFIVGMMELKRSGNGKMANVKKLRKHLTSKLFSSEGQLDSTYQRLKQKISRRFFTYVWTDEDNFSINQHVPMYKGPLPRSKEDTEKIFVDFVADPFPKDISPWRMQIVPKEDGSGFLLLCKIHHALGDGFAMVGLLSNLVDTKPNFISLSNRKVTFASSSIKRILTGILTGPLALLALVFSIRFQNPFQIKDRPTKKVISWSNSISLDYVKKIKTKTDSTVNDVLMACLAGAVRSYLLNEKDSLKDPSDLPIAMTYNSRSLSDKTKQLIPLGNNSGGVLFHLPVSITDPVERLHITKEKLLRLKSLSYPQIISTIYSSLIGALPGFVGKLSASSIKRHVSLIVSNIPGPVDTITMMGDPVDEIMFAPPLVGDTGLSISLFSYNGSIKMTVMSDQSIMKSPQDLIKNFEEEVCVLGKSLLGEDKSYD